MKVTAFILSILFVCVSISCNEKVTQEDLIQSALSLKTTQWRELQIKLCTDRAYAEAEAFVDSIMVINALPTKLDTIPKPPKPMKPPKPYFRTKPDSVVVKELEKKN